MNALGRGLLREFPNPERIGCPGAEVLKTIAAHQMPLSEAEKWLDHFGSCSPCYADFKRLQEAHDSRRRQMILAVAAAILLTVAVTGWALLHKRSENLTAQTATLDLRNRSIARGEETNPNEQPLELARTAENLRILLPIGSSGGPYDVGIATTTGETLVGTSGTAELVDRVILLRVGVHLSGIRPGKYILQIRRPGMETNSYPLLLR